MSLADLGWDIAGPVLVVAAHPDDEVLGAGGTIARLASRHRVVIAILGEGVTSRYVSRSDAEPAALAELRAQAQEAGAALGAQEVRLLGLPDNRFDGLDLLDVVKCIEGLVAEFAPTIVFTHHPGDLNVDHGITFRAVLTATRPMVGGPVRDLYTFEVPSSTDWAFQRIEPTFRPNLFVDVGDTIEHKVRAMQRYRGESRPFPHPRSAEALRSIARRWGAVVGREYAEAFEVVRTIR